MDFKNVFLVIFCSLFLILTSAGRSQAQLENTFTDIFEHFLGRADQDGNITPGLIAVSGEFHGAHFIPASKRANELLTPALNSLIATNVSSFPLSSTSAGVTFDFSTGRPVSISESLGPIVAETAPTLGKGKLNIGFNYTYLNFSSFRGLPLKDMRFTFFHEDHETEFPYDPDESEEGSLGIPGFESDNIDFFLNLETNASIFVMFITAGITSYLDLSVAAPIININLSGNAKAVINSFTYGHLNPNRPEFEGAAHRFNDDPLNPVLQANQPYSVSANGLGDIAVRLKYNFLRGSGLNSAILLDTRIPTGDEKDFLGTGKMVTRILGIFSSKFGDFTPHLNIGYVRRNAELDSDELEFRLGFDQKIGKGLTFAIDFLGSIDLNDDELIKLFPGTKTIHQEFEATADSTGSRNGAIYRIVDWSNVPETDNDNTFDAAIGFRYAASERFIILGNVIIPLNDKGLRSSIASTVGLTISL